VNPLRKLRKETVMSRPFLTVAALSTLLLAACDAPPPQEPADANTPAADRTTLQDVQQQGGEALAAAIQYARQEYAEKIAPRVDMLQEKAGQLKEQIEQSARDAQPELEKRLDQLHERLRAAEQGLADARDAGEEAWQQAQTRLEDVMTELREELEAQGITTTQPAEEPPPASEEGG
jgi:hypothetical protein